MTIAVIIRTRLFALLGLSAACAVASGCFDAAALTQAKLDEAARLRLEDVDLGEYRITLPRRPGGNAGGVVQFHAFGQVANRDLTGIQESLDQADSLIRHEMLMAVRQLQAEDLTEPELTLLRERIAQVMNASLEGDPVQGVGFYSLSFNTL